MNTIRSRGFFSSVSSLALLSVFFIGGVSSIQNASSATFEAKDGFERAALKQSRLLSGFGDSKENVFGNAQKTSSSRQKAERSRKEQEDLDETLKSSQAKLEEEMRKLGEKERRIIELTEEVSRMEESLKIAEHNKKIDEEKMMRLRAQIAGLESNVRVINQNNQTLKETSEADKKKIQDLTHTLHELQSNVDDQAEKIKDLRSSLEKAESAERVALKEKTKLKIQKEALEKEMAANRQKLAEMQERLASLTLDVEALRAKEKEIARTIFTFVEGVHLETDILDGVSMETVLEGMNLDLLLGNVTQKLNARSAEAESRRLVLEREIEALKKQSAQDKQEIERKEKLFERKTAAQEQEIGKLSASISALEERIAGIEEERSQLKSELEEKTAHLRQETQRNEVLDQEVKRLNEELKKAQGRLRELERDLGLAQQEKSALEDAKNHISQLLELAQNTAAQDKAALNKEIENLRSQIQNIQQKGKDELEALERQYQSSLEDLTATYKENMSKAEKDIESKNQAHQKVVEQLDAITKEALAAKTSYLQELNKAQEELSRTQAAAERRVAEQQAEFLERTENLGQEHGRQIEQLKEEQASVIAEKNALIRDIQTKIAQLEQAMTQDQERHALRLLELEIALKTAGEEKEAAQREYEKKMQDLKTDHQLKLASSEEKLMSMREELVQTLSLLTASQLSGIENVRSSEEQIRQLRLSLEQEAEKNREALNQLKNAHEALLRENDQRHQEITVDLQEKLRLQAEKIEEKEASLRDNQISLSDKERFIEKLKKKLKKVKSGTHQQVKLVATVAEYEEKAKEALERQLKDAHKTIADSEELMRVANDQLEADKQALEKAESEKRTLEDSLEFVNAEILLLKAAERALESEKEQQKEIYTRNQQELTERLEKSLKVNQELERQLREANSILEEIAQSQSQFDFSRLGEQEAESLVQPLSLELAMVDGGNVPHYRSVAQATHRMVELVRLLQASERTLTVSSEEARSQITRLEADKNTHDQQVDQLISQRQQKETDLNKAIEVLQGQITEIQSLHKELKDRDLVIQQSERERGYLSKELLEKETRIEALEAKIKELTTSKAELTEIISAITEELSQEQEKARQFKEAVQSLSATLNESRTAAEDLEAAQEESLLKILEEKRRAISEQKEEYLGDIQSLHELLAEARGKLEAAQNEINATKNFTDLQVEEAYRVADERVKLFEQKIAHLVSEIEETRTLLTEKENALHENQVKLEKAQANLRDQKTAFEVLQGKHKQLQDLYDDSEARVEILTEQLNEKIQENDSIAELLSTAQGQQKRLQTQMEQEKDAKDKLIKQLHAAKSNQAEAANRQSMLTQIVQEIDRPMTDSGVNPVTPVKQTRGSDASKTPPHGAEELKGATYTPGKGLKAAMSPNLKALGQGLGQFQDQDQAFKYMVEFFRNAGLQLPEFGKNPLDQVQGRSPLRDLTAALKTSMRGGDSFNSPSRLKSSMKRVERASSQDGNASPKAQKTLFS